MAIIRLPSGASVDTGAIEGETGDSSGTVEPVPVRGGVDLIISSGSGGGGGSTPARQRQTRVRDQPGLNLVLESSGRVRKRTKKEILESRLEQVDPQLALARQQALKKQAIVRQQVKSAEQKAEFKAQQQFQKDLDSGKITKAGPVDIRVGDFVFRFDIKSKDDLVLLRSGPTRAKLKALTSQPKAIPDLLRTEKQLKLLGLSGKQSEAISRGLTRQQLKDLNQVMKLSGERKQSVANIERYADSLRKKIPKKGVLEQRDKGTVVQFVRDIIRSVPPLVIDTFEVAAVSLASIPLFVEGLKTETGKKELKHMLPKVIKETPGELVKTFDGTTPSGALNILLAAFALSSIRGKFSKTKVTEKVTSNNRGVSISRTTKTKVGSKSISTETAVDLSASALKKLRKGKTKASAKITVRTPNTVQSARIPINIKIKAGSKLAKAILVAERVVKKVGETAKKVKIKKKAKKAFKALTKKKAKIAQKKVAQVKVAKLKTVVKLPFAKISKVVRKATDPIKIKIAKIRREIFLTRGFKEISAAGKKRRLKQLREELKGEINKQLQLPRLAVKRIKAKLSVTKDLLKKKSLKPFKDILKITKAEFLKLKKSVQVRLINKLRLFYRRIFTKKVKVFEVKNRINLGRLRISIVKQLDKEAFKKLKVLKDVDTSTQKITSTIKEVAKKEGLVLRASKGKFVIERSAKRLRKILRKKTIKEFGSPAQQTLLARGKGLSKSKIIVPVVVKKTIQNIAKDIKEIPTTSGRQRQILIQKTKKKVNKLDTVLKTAEVKATKQRAQQKQILGDLSRSKQPGAKSRLKVVKAAIKITTASLLLLPPLNREKQRLAQGLRQAILSKPAQKIKPISRLKPKTVIKPKVTPIIATIPLLGIVPATTVITNLKLPRLFLDRLILFPRGGGFTKVSVGSGPFAKRVLRGFVVKKGKSFVFAPDLESIIFGIKAKKLQAKNLLRVGRVFTGLERRAIVR